MDKRARTRCAWLGAASLCLSVLLPAWASPESQRMEGRVDVTVGQSSDPHKLLEEGLQEFAGGNDAQAEAAFQHVMALDPNNSTAMYNLGAIAERRGDLDAALHDYKLAAEYNQGDVELQKTVAAVEEEISRRRELQARAQAEKAYEEAASQARGRPYHRAPLPSGQQAPNLPPPAAGASARVAELHKSKGATVAKTAAGLAVIVGVGAAFGRGGGLGALHCPLCEMLRKF